MATLIRNTEYMNNTVPNEAEPNQAAPNNSEEMTGMAPDDPRIGFAAATKAVGDLMEHVSNDQLGLPTPCSEFDVKALLDHMVMVMQRVAVLGNGQHFSTANEMTAARETGHADAFREAAHDVQKAWTDSAKLAAMYEVPWGELPGAPLLLIYTAELATHGWDLATALGLKFAIADEYLEGALVAVRMIPDDGRDDPMVPFDAVVDPGNDAPLLLKIAGWGGRQVV